MINNKQLKKIKVSGFKSFKNCELELGKINLLIGANGAGKSNFISIFNMLKEIIEKRFQSYVMKSAGANALMFNGRKATDRINFEFFFGDNSYDFSLVPTDNNTLFFESEHFNYGGFWDNKSSVGGGYTESQWNRGVNNKIDKYVKPVLQDQVWRVYHFHDTSESAKVKQTTNVFNNVELQKDAGNLAAFLLRLKNEYPINYHNIVEYIKLVAPYFDDFYLEPTNKDDIILRWKQVGSDDFFNANQFSDGTLRFICLACLFLQPENLQPSTIILDEPELGLHPYAITILSELIKQSSINKQIIIGTQSSELLNEFEPEDIIVVDRNDEDGTIFNRFTQKELEDWLNCDYTIGDLWKKNVLGGRP